MQESGVNFDIEVVNRPVLQSRAPRGEDPRVLNQLMQFRLEQLPPDQAQVVLVFLLLVGIVYCFVGYAILRFVLALTGFLIAGTAAAVLGGWFSQGNLLAMAASILFGGACGAMALTFLYRAGVFIVGFLGALLLAFSLLFEGDAAIAPVGPADPEVGAPSQLAVFARH